MAAMGPVTACKLVAEMELKTALDVMLSLRVRRGEGLEMMHDGNAEFMWTTGRMGVCT